MLKIHQFAIMCAPTTSQYAAVEAMKNAGYREIRLGVDYGNPQSFAFWSKNKFVVIQEKEYIVMKRVLS